MELLKSIVVDFVLFSSIEGFIFCLFFEKIGKCRKFKWYEWLILSIGNCLISQLLPPLLYQVVCIIWMALFIHFSNEKNIFDTVKLSFKSVIFFLVCEMLFAMFYDFILELDFTNAKNIVVFIMTLPIRLVEIILIRRYKTMKIWIGESKKRK